MKVKPYSISELKVEAGDIPPPTCPIIDKCIKEISKVSDDLVYLKKHAYKYDNINDFINDLPDLDEGFLLDQLEIIREANGQLRRLGEFGYEKFKELLKKFE